GDQPPSGGARESDPIQGQSGLAEGTRGKRESRPKPARKKSTRRGRTAGSQPDVEPAWRLSPFRLLLYAAFSYLSLQPTRNSHQFAAVVGTATAWNFGEWAAAIERRKWTLRTPGAGPAREPGQGPAQAPASSAMTPRLVAGAATIAVLLWVGSGWFYEMTG